jgi:hypothetical protein
LQEQVAQFLRMFGGVLAVDGVDNFIGLLDGVRLQGFKRLLFVPWATLLGSKGCDDIEEPCKRGGTGVRLC